MNKTRLFDRTLNTLGIAATLWFSWQVTKSVYEPRYPDAVQYKASTTAPLYSGFDTDKDAKIDSITIYQCPMWGYRNETITPKDSGFYRIRKILDEQKGKKSFSNIYSGESLHIPADKID